MCPSRLYVYIYCSYFGSDQRVREREKSRIIGNGLDLVSPWKRVTSLTRLLKGGPSKRGMLIRHNWRAPLAERGTLQRLDNELTAAV